MYVLFHAWQTITLEFNIFIEPTFIAFTSNLFEVHWKGDLHSSGNIYQIRVPLLEC